MGVELPRIARSLTPGNNICITQKGRFQCGGLYRNDPFRRRYRFVCVDTDWSRQTGSGYSLHCTLVKSGQVRRVWDDDSVLIERITASNSTFVARRGKYKC